jgi:hypothetical protein
LNSNLSLSELLGAYGRFAVQVKLSIKGDGSELQCIWAGSVAMINSSLCLRLLSWTSSSLAGNGLLAAANGETLVRFYNLESEDNVNYVLSLSGNSRRQITLRS